MPQPKYVKREYKKKYTTVHKVAEAINNGSNNAQRRKNIKKATSGSDTFTLSDSQISKILKPFAKHNF